MAATTAPAAIRPFLEAQRSAHLATADRSGLPHLVPVCFAYDGSCFFIAIDQKPKRVSPMRLKRVRNILENPKVALLLDHYEEPWENLTYVLVLGTATVVDAGPEHDKAIALLREKYRQYRSMNLEEAPVIAISPGSFVSWSNVAER